MKPVLGSSPLSSPARTAAAVNTLKRKYTGARSESFEGAVDSKSNPKEEKPRPLKRTRGRAAPTSGAAIAAAPDKKRIKVESSVAVDSDATASSEA